MARRSRTGREVSSLGERSQNEEDHGGPDLRSLEVFIGRWINKGHTIKHAGRVREEIVTSNV
jgi:hypothetical protein